MKGTVKTFIEEHKTGLVIAGGVGLTVLGGVLGWKMCNKAIKGKYMLLTLDHPVTKVIKDAKTEHYPKFSSFSGWNLDGIKSENLGELHEIMTKFDVPEDAVFTHFICIGPEAK